MSLLPVLLTPVANLPLVSTTPVVSVAKFAASVVNTGGKFDLRISPQIVEKIWNDFNVIFGALGKMVHKSVKQKILAPCPFKGT